MTLAPFHGGWTHNYNVWLADLSNSVSITDWQGSWRTFTLTNGVYEGDGSSTLIKTNGDFVWQLTHATKYLFDSVHAYRLSNVTDRVGNYVTLRYDSSNLLTGAVDNAGRKLAIQYNASNQLARVIDPLVRTNTFDYDAPGRLSVVSDVLGTRAQYVYGDSLLSNSITRMVNARGYTNSFVYNALGQAIKETNALGKAQLFDWVGTNRQVTVTQFNGTSYTIYNNVSGAVTARVDAAGTTKYFRDGQQRLTSIQDRLGNSTLYQYDTNGCACALSGNLLMQIDALQRTNLWTYESSFNFPATFTNAAGGVTLWSYDTKGNVTTNTDAAQQITRYGYDGAGNRTSVIDANQHTTTFGYDQYGNRTNITDALQHRTSFGYDLVGRLTSRTNALQKGESFTWDDRDRLTRYINGAGETNRWGYDGNGNRTVWTNELGYARTYGYDPLDRLTSITLPGGGSAFLTFGYDDANNRTNVTDALGHTTKFGYDALGRLTAVTNALSKVWTFAVDAEGRRTRSLDPNGHTNGFVHDAVGQITVWTNALNKVTTFGYDKLGNLGTLTDPRSNPLTFGYDPMSRLARITYAGSSYESFCYDGVGNVTSITNRAVQVIALTYDDANRLTQKSYVGTNDVFSYSYDVANQLTGVGWTNGAANVSTLVFACDAAGRLTNEVQTVGQASSLSIGYEYYADGRRKKLAYPDATFITYEYNTKGWLTAIKDGGTNNIVTYDYDDAGRRTSRTLENNTLTVYDYDDADQLTSIWHKQNGGATLSQYQYSYDAAGNRTNMVGTSGSLVRSESYSYDAADQLAGATYKTGGTIDRTVSYVYDAAGNRSNMVETLGSATNTTTYVANSDNQLTSVTSTQQGLIVTGTVDPGPRSNKWYSSTATARGVSAGVNQTNGTFSISGVPVTGGANALTVTVTDVSANIATQVVNITVVSGLSAIGYDANGNQTNDAVWGYTYDRENRLVSATNSTVNISYTYDALGRLIERRTSGSSVATNRLYYAGWQLIAEYNGTGALQRKYVYGPGIDEPIRMAGGGTNYYYHADGLGSVTGISDWTGAKAESYTYDVYGTPTFYNALGVVTNGSGLGNRLLFTGHNYDLGTGLYNNRLRYYSPRIGRFMEPDPMRILGDRLNMYTYTLNNPTTFVDPDGASAQEASQYWTDFAANGYGNGLLGGLQSFWGNSMNMFIDMWNAVEIEQHAEKSGYYSAIPGCAGKAWGHGLAAGGLLAWDYFKFTGLSKVRGPELGRWKEAGEWQEGWHFHIDLGNGLGTHHLPQQTGNFLKNLGAVISRWWNP